MQEINYSIHDIITIQVNKNSKSSLIEDLNNPLSYFKTERECSDPDIIINIGMFKPSNHNCYIVDHKYYIKNNYFYCKDSGGKAKWEFEIMGFEDGKTVINFNSIVFGLRENILFPDLIYHNLLLKPLIEYKLCNDGYYFIHAAAIEKKDKAYLFSGRGASFKTSVVMDCIRKAGFNFLGDDRVILDANKKILCFPMHPLMFDFRLKYLMTEDYKTFGNRLHLVRYLSSDKKHSFPITNISNLRLLLNLTRKCGTTNVHLEKIDNKNLVSKLVINEMGEMIRNPSLNLVDYGSHFYKYMLLYSYIYPNSRIAAHWSRLEEGLRPILENIESYALSIPQEYSVKTFNDLCIFLKKIENKCMM